MAKTLEQRRKEAALLVFEHWGTQAEFARAAGYTPAKVSRALDPAQVTDRKLAPLEVKIAELLGGGDDSVDQPEASRADAGGESAVIGEDVFYLVIHTPTGNVRIPCKAVGTPVFEGPVEIHSPGVTLDQ